MELEAENWRPCSTTVVRRVSGELEAENWRPCSTTLVRGASVELEECPTTVSHESFLQECPTRVSHKSVLQECPTRVSYKSVLQECPTRVSYKSVIWTYVAFRTCFHSGSWVPSCSDLQPTSNGLQPTTSDGHPSGELGDPDLGRHLLGLKELEEFLRDRHFSHLRGRLSCELSSRCQVSQLFVGGHMPPSHEPSEFGSYHSGLGEGHELYQ